MVASILKFSSFELNRRNKSCSGWFRVVDKRALSRVSASWQPPLHSATQCAARWWPCKMHEGRVRRVYERRRLVTKPLSSLPAASLWMRELKRNFPHKADSLCRSLLSLSSLLLSCRSPRSPLLPLHHRRLSQRGVCLMKLSREGPLSFCSAAMGYTLLASNALLRRELCVVPYSACDFTHSPCPFYDSRDQPFQHFSSPALLVALPFPQSFT